MYGITQLTVEERVFEFACDATYGGRSIDSLLNKYHLEYRKGKTVEDLKNARKLSFSRNVNPTMFADEFAKRLLKILKSSI